MKRKMELLTLCELDGKFYLDGLLLKGVKHYEIKKSSDYPKGTAELSVVIAIKYFDNKQEQNPSQMTEGKE